MDNKKSDSNNVLDKLLNEIMNLNNEEREELLRQWKSKTT